MTTRITSVTGDDNQEEASHGVVLAMLHTLACVAHSACAAAKRRNRLWLLLSAYVVLLAAMSAVTYITLQYATR